MANTPNQPNYKFYPKLGQIVVEGEYKKKEIVRIYNISRGTEIYAPGQILTVRKTIENGIQKTVLKFSSKNPLLKAMEDDDQISFEFDFSERMAKVNKEQDREADRAKRERESDAQIAADKKDSEKAYRRSYHGADSIKKKSLVNLIGSRWERGESLTSATKSAITDKFVAKMTRIKRVFDPLGWVSGALGSVPLVGGIAKKVGVSALGSLFGRDPDTIRYFGGYARDKKDPKRTKLGPGQVRNLESGDSSADILAKMYNFMVKDFERQKKERELENDFRQEQKDEAERRHKKLVEEIQKLSGAKPAEVPKEDKDKKSFLDSIMGGFKKVISTVKGLALMLAPFLLGVFDLIKGIGKMLPSIMDMMKPIASIIGTVASALKTFVVSFFERVILRDIIGRVWGAFTALVSAVAGPLAMAVGSLLGPVGVALGVGALGGLAVGVGAGALEEYTTKVQREAFTSTRESGPGQQAKILEEDYARKKEEARIRHGGDKWLKEYGSDIRARDERAAIDTWYKAEKAKLQEKQNLYFRDFIAPILEKEGYSIDMSRVSETSKGKAGDLDLPVIMQGGKELSSTEYNALAARLAISKSVQKTGQDMFLGVQKSIDTAVQQNLLPSVTNKIEELSAPLLDRLKNIPNMLEDEPDNEPEVQQISMNNSNSIGGKARYSDTTPISPRIRNDSIQLALARTTYVI